MLAGCLPYHDNPKTGEEYQPPEFEMPIWRGLDAAIDLINNIFDRKEVSPMMAEQALRHKFFSKQNHERQPLRPDLSSAMSHYLMMTRLKNAFNNLKPA